MVQVAEILPHCEKKPYLANSIAVDDKDLHNKSYHG